MPLEQLRPRQLPPYAREEMVAGRALLASIARAISRDAAVVMTVRNREISAPDRAK